MFKFFENLVEPYPAEEPTEPPQGLWAFCNHYTKGLWPLLLLMAFLTAVIAVIEVNLYAFMGNIVDWLSTTDKQSFWQDHATNITWLVVLVLVIYPIIIFTQSTIMHQSLLGNYPMIVRWQAHRYLLKQSLNFFNNEFAGRIGAKVMQTSLAVREVVMKLLDVMVFVVVYFFGIVAILGSADIRLLVPMAVWISAYIFMIYYFIPKLRDISKAQADARSMMTGRVVDSYSNIATVKLFSHSKMEADYGREGMDEFLRTVHAQMRLVTQFQTWLSVINMVQLIAISFLVLQFWLADAISVGALAVAISLVLRMNGMSHWIMWEVSALFEQIGTVQDGMGTLAQPREVLDTANAPQINVQKGDIKFEHVKFNYGKAGGIIDDMSLHIKHGEKIGLVGRSGAGKSTLINLLLRLYDVEGGKISVDGRDISQIDQDSLRKNIGVVTQDTSLFHRSVAENIAYGVEGATREQVIAAAKRANADEFIHDLVDDKGNSGYDTLVGERGVKLSGGQRQRIAIARVFLKDAPILVLDEATSALDSEVEFAIQENLLELMAGKTVIAIAHRLSTISALDRLIVLDKGEIIEDGTHEELANGNGIYSDLWKRQSGGFLLEEAAEVAQ
ncbi:MAG: ABC transporter ATP-binding protein [Rhizobiales bacterium]|nr:ABC transporter ATP-binding protein/permease [Hyphomicrobiales bacterium]NRB14106.1 ABC transporter ATP-binding protein [Hyphomicrobiales bacterium]